MIEVKIISTSHSFKHEKELSTHLNDGWSLTQFSVTTHGFYSVLEREKEDD